MAAPVPFYSSPALLIQLKFDLTLLLFCGFRRATLRMLAIQANRSQIFTKNYVRVIRHSTHHLEFGEPADRNSWASLLPDLSSVTQEGAFFIFILKKQNFKNICRIGKFSKIGVCRPLTCRHPVGDRT